MAVVVVVLLLVVRILLLLHNCVAADRHNTQSVPSCSICHFLSTSTKVIELNSSQLNSTKNNHGNSTIDEGMYMRLCVKRRITVVKEIVRKKQLLFLYWISLSLKLDCIRVNLLLSDFDRAGLDGIVRNSPPISFHCRNVLPWRKLLLNFVPWNPLGKTCTCGRCA